MATFPGLESISIDRNESGSFTPASDEMFVGNGWIDPDGSATQAITVGGSTVADYGSVKNDRGQGHSVIIAGPGQAVSAINGAVVTGVILKNAVT